MTASVALLDPPPARRLAERTALAELLRRIRSEYLEIPGLILTRQQARRLWALDEGTCDLALELLIDARFLRRTAQGYYVRAE